ncbi:hypothetical protein U9M48_029573 [Paspalum notatum var. saurae]|uniref:DUF6598 domain-containing protein n=1 Tax=Paspalum notatum var. saurae TaxID=547442 RepID=A0AAQ3U3A0_PASNO
MDSDDIMVGHLHSPLSPIEQILGEGIDLLPQKQAGDAAHNMFGEMSVGEVVWMKKNKTYSTSVASMAKKDDTRELFDEMRCTDIVWDEEMQQSPNLHYGLLQQLALGHEYKDEKIYQMVELSISDVVPNVGGSPLFSVLSVRNVSRDMEEECSLINMVGPKRGIDIMDQALIEYDMRIKAGEHEKDDLQLIDGASIIGPAVIWNCPLTFQIASDSGAVGLTLSYLQAAVEATVEVFILEARSSFNLSLGCLTSGLNKEIRLFDGVIAESCFLKRSVVAVLKDSLIVLKFKLGSLLSGSDQHCCSFKSKTHGHDTQEIKTDFALFSMKVTWSTLPNAI